MEVAMEKSISVAEAKATLSECIRQVESGSFMLITRHGKPVAALVRPADLEHLERLRKAGPESGLAGIAGGWENSEELAAILESSPRYGHRDIADLEH
jgi:prevent-host-death family protein